MEIHHEMSIATIVADIDEDYGNEFIVAAKGEVHSPHNLEWKF